METLVAISLTANILQFAQLAGRLLSETKSIRETGSPRTLPELQKLVKELNNQTELVHKDLLTKAGNSELESAEKNLIDITYECRTAGSSFSNYLDTLIQPSSSGNHLKTAVASIKFQLVHGKIEEFALKLDRLRSTLTLACILAFQARTQTSQKDILARLHNLHEDNKAHFTTASDDIQALTNVHQVNQSQTEQRLKTVDTLMRQCLQDLGNLKSTLSRTREREILTWLNFRQISWRFDEVSTAYEETFEWIFEEITHDYRWADFPAHLRGSTTKPYFIQGKAGSGKSTLMKYIIDHPSTKACLKEWAEVDGAELIIAHFFFWNSGTTLQKSATGLLRALLFAVLERHTELIPVVFSKIYQYWDGDASEPNYTELTNAWLLLTQKSASFLKIAIFIDGMDEFEGDHKGIATFIRSLASDQLKVVVSSRPITACLRVFRECPSLTLHDITAQDMDKFIRGQLESHVFMIQLLHCHPQEAVMFIHQIRWKANGVFLWVKLVIKELVEGLEDGDSLKDLQGKLELIPDDLRQLYRQMLSKIPTGYHNQAAEIFKLIHLWQTHASSGPVSLATLYFALEPASTCHELKAEPLNSNTAALLIQKLSARIQSRCCGLIEVFNHGYNNMTNDLDSWRVGYTHRTVREFLASEDVLKEIDESTKSATQLGSALMAGCLSKMKISDRELNSGPRWPDVQSFALLYRYLAGQTQENLDKYIDTLDTVMTQVQSQTIGRSDRHWSERPGFWFYDAFLAKISFDREDILRQSSIFTFAAQMGFNQYLESRCPRNVLETPIMFLHTLDPTANFGMPSWAEARDTQIFLLKHLAKTNNAVLEQALFNVLTENLDIEKSDRDYLDFDDLSIATMLTTAHSASQLLRNNWWIASHLRNMIEHLRTSEDPQDESMSRQLSDMINEHEQQQTLPIRIRRSESPDETPRKKQRITSQ